MLGIADAKAGFGSAVTVGGGNSYSHPQEFREDRAEGQNSPVAGEPKENMKTAPCSHSWTTGATQLGPIYFLRRNGEGRRPLSDIQIPG